MLLFIHIFKESNLCCIDKSQFCWPLHQPEVPWEVHALHIQSYSHYANGWMYVRIYENRTSWEFLNITATKYKYPNFQIFSQYIFKLYRTLQYHIWLFNYFTNQANKYCKIFVENVGRFGYDYKMPHEM